MGALALWSVVPTPQSGEVRRDAADHPFTERQTTRFLIFSLPIIPQRECPVIPCSIKISLSNTTSTVSIEKYGTSVWGLRSKSCPFVIAPKLSIPIICYDRFLPMFHFRLHVRFPSIFFQGCFRWKRCRKAIVHSGMMFQQTAAGIISMHPQHHAPCSGATRRQGTSRGRNQQPLGRRIVVR